MASEASIDLLALERQLQQLTASIRSEDDEQSWLKVQEICQELANHLRVRNGPVDHHSSLGKTELPQTLTTLLSSGLHGSHIPGDERTAPVLEILRVGANLCMDHDDNRAALLEVGFPQSVLSLLEGYVETIPFPPDSIPLRLSIPHLKIIRTSIGVLLNASIGYDHVKYRLISLEAALTIIKLSSSIYPPTSWTLHQSTPLEDSFVEEWNIRCGISDWAWRTISALKDIQDETLQITNSDILPWITAPLLKFCSSSSSDSTSLADSDPDLFDLLVQTDFDFLEESCTIIESLSLDVEDFRLELARATCYPAPDKATPSLDAIIEFIENGSYPSVWKNPIFEDVERKNKEKSFDICKAALIKAVVEVFAEEKNEELLWKNDDSETPGGPLVGKFVQWVRGYLESLDAKEATSFHGRDDMAICASLSLGNLVRKATYATALLSPPYSLAPTLSSPHLFSPRTDIKLKHGILGLLKHLSQFSRQSPTISSALVEVCIIDRISTSGIWDEKSDAMADVIQLNAIGVARHLCNASLDHTFAFILQSKPEQQSGLSQILALIKRSDSLSIKSEGSRLLVNVVKSLWFTDRADVSTEERQKKRERCIAAVLTPELVTTLTALIGRSNKYPILVNEGLVAISLLCTHKLGGPLVLDALTARVNGAPPSDDEELMSPTVRTENPLLPTHPSGKDGLPVPRHALDMLVFVLRNVDNPVNFPIEVRVNACTFFLQLQRYATGPALEQIRETVLPVVVQVAEDSTEVEGEEKLVKAANQLIETWKPKPALAPSTT